MGDKTGKTQQDGPLMTKSKITPEEALAYHLEPRPGKYDIVASTPPTRLGAGEPTSGTPKTRVRPR